MVKLPGCFNHSLFELLPITQQFEMPIINILMILGSEIQVGHNKDGSSLIHVMPAGVRTSKISFPLRCLVPKLERLE